MHFILIRSCQLQDHITHLTVTPCALQICSGGQPRKVSIEKRVQRTGDSLVKQPRFGRFFQPCPLRTCTLQLIPTPPVAFKLSAPRGLLEILVDHVPLVLYCEARRIRTRIEFNRMFGATRTVLAPTGWLLVDHYNNGGGKFG